MKTLRCPVLAVALVAVLALPGCSRDDKAPGNAMDDRLESLATLVHEDGGDDTTLRREVEQLSITLDAPTHRRR